MIFSDFVEGVKETQICYELKQKLDKWYELYVKDPEKCIEQMSTRGSSKSYLFVHLLLLAKLYERSRNDGNN